MAASEEAGHRGARRSDSLPSLFALRRSALLLMAGAYVSVVLIVWIMALGIARRSVRDEQALRTELLERRVAEYLDLTASALAMLGESLDPVDRARNAEELSVAQSVFPRFNGIHLLDGEGRVLAAAEGDPVHHVGFDFSAEPSFVSAREGMRLGVSGIHLSERSGRSAITMTYPLKKAEAFSGALSVEADLSFLADLVAQGGAKGTETFIVDGNGIIAAHTDAQRLGLPCRRLGLVEKAKSGLVFSMRKDEVTGKQVLATARPIVQGWTVVTLVPAWIAMEDTNRTMFAASLLFLALVTLISVILWMGLSSMLAPVQALSLRATRAANPSSLLSGALLPASPLPSHYREIASLVEAFDHMIESLASGTRELTQSRARLASYFDNAPEAIFIVDGDGTIRDMNPAGETLLGWSASELVGTDMLQVIAEDRRSHCYKTFGRLKAEGRARSETAFTTRDGERRAIALSASILPGGNYIIHCDDITARRKIDETLQRVQRLESIGLLAGGIAHDFNNLLSGIFGNVEIAGIQLEAGNAGGARDALARALGVFDRARDLTRQLLTFSKGGAPVLSRVDAAALMAKSAAFTLSGSSVELVNRMGRGVWDCRADANQLSQVFDNLALNAVQAMPDGGRLFLDAWNLDARSGDGSVAGVPGLALPVTLPRGRWILLRMKDTGPGLGKAALEKLFMPFFTTKREGTGLGLATAYSIVKRHGGLLEFDGKETGGACFNVWLPAWEDLAAPADGAGGTASGGPEADGRTDDASSASGALSGKTVLVLDDEAAVRDAAAEYLRALGCRVEIAATEEECHDALASLAESSIQPDFLILDLTLPGGPGGKDILPRLQALCPGAAALAMSGYSEDPVMAAPEAYGFDASLRKPFLRSELSGALYRAARRRATGRS